MDAELDALVREGLLSDERFCEVFVRNRAGSGYGPLRIRQELTQRGIDEALAGQALAAVEADWAALAAEVRRRRFGERLPRGYPEWAKQARFLQYRGFGSETIRAALGGDADDQAP